MIFRYLMWFMLLMLCTLYLAVKAVKVQGSEYRPVIEVQEQLLQVNQKMNTYIDQQELEALRN